MDEGTVAQIEDWEQHPFSGGYVGIADLADGDFSGALRSGGHWLFMLNGRVVGSAGGTIADFEGESGTAYEAPHPGLPLLFAMQERGGETKARYFTDDTPLEEVHETLSSGNFTGFVELSENVHSGDYYVVYYGGRALKVAFVGGTGRLLTDEEAFEQAADEVGIYEVRDVDLDVRDVPEPEGSSTEAAVVATEPSEGTAEPDAPDPDRDGPSADTNREGQAHAATDPDRGEPADAEGKERPRERRADRGESSASDSTEPTAPEREVGEKAIERSASTRETPSDGSSPGSEPPASDGSSPVEETEATSDRTDETTSDRTDETTGASVSEGPSPPDRGEREAGQPDDSGRSTTPSTADAESPDDPFSEERAWRETRSVPALDPEETELVAKEPERPESQGADSGAESPESRASGTAESRASGTAEVPASETAEAPAPPERITALEDELEELRDRLETVLAERDRLREERDQLERRVERLREAGETDTATEGRMMSPAEALDGTDLLVRYGSKGDPTLEDARDDEGVTPQEVEANLRLEKHTRFEADDVVVEGEPYEAFVDGTLEYRFATWVVTALLFEIRETGNATALSDLYDAIPEIDRVEFDAAITMRDEEGEEHREAFDVVFRDQMGQPVAVVTLNDDRDPASGDMMVDLVESATAVAEAQNSLSAAFGVTASFFEPAALETAEEATSAGLLNRDSRKSFVKTSRKRGYHLCLVEAHGDEFRIAVPDL